LFVFVVFISLPLIFASEVWMELRHLRYFVTLAEELHFARAAERPNVPSPTLTVQIQEIERSLSARLFFRTKRSVALTPAGEVSLDEARNVLEIYDRTESIGRVEIGYAGVPLEETSTSTLARDGHVDIGFIRLPMTLPRALKIHNLLRDTSGLAFPSDHPEAGSIGPVQPKPSCSRCIHHAGAGGWDLRGCSAR
jgi:DNA-binding transcriptional LysR family regulator